MSLLFVIEFLDGLRQARNLLLTLGAHAQRGLQYLVCVSVCLSVTTFSATAHNNAPNKIYQRLQRDMSKVLKMAFSLKMLRSGVTAIFAYAAKSAIFFTLVSMRIPAHAHVVCSLLNAASLLW